MSLSALGISQKLTYKFSASMNSAQRRERDLVEFTEPKIKRTYIMYFALNE